ncbi:hypothetical protein ACQCN2_10890 [Brevibacillus ginsengisoli]|uniref:hypothetical protein n=1 Tax=Brevibacillus ginsengisoli TaxID=363854 RepID=UPI003CED6DB7
MNTTQQSDELRDLFQDTQLPEVDVKDRVLQKIYERANQKEVYPMKIKVSLITAAVLIFVATTAFAAIKVYEIKSNNSDFVVQVKETDQPSASHSNSYRDKINQAREALEPNTAAAVYVVSKENPDKRISYITKPLISTDLKVIQQEAGNRFSYPSELVGGYTFKEGYVYHHYNDRQYNENVFYDEAEKTKKDVIIKELTVDSKVESMRASYAGSKGEFSIMFHKLDGITSMSSNAGPNDKVEKVKIHNIDALYHEMQIPEDNEVVKYLEMIKEDTHVSVTIHTASPQITKDDLVEIAKALK